MGGIYIMEVSVERNVFNLFGMSGGGSEPKKFSLLSSLEVKSYLLPDLYSFIHKLKFWC